MNKENISIKTEHITLGQLLKFINLVSTGGEVKQFLQNDKVLINGEQTTNRGKKILPGDLVKIENQNLMLEIVSETGSPKE